MANGQSIDKLFYRLAIGATTLILAGVIGWAKTISTKLDDHIARRVHYGAALRATADTLAENQRLLWYEIDVNRSLIERLGEKPIKAVRPLQKIPRRENGDSRDDR